jgi:transposase
MLIKTILNSVTDYKSFRFGKVSFQKKDTPDQHIIAVIHPHKNGKILCSECGCSCPIYDTARTARRFEFVPLWDIPVFLYKMRRVTCPEHGIVVESVPWSDGKHSQTIEQRQFLANWARRLSWSEVAECFQTTYGKVFHAVKWIVDRGLQHRNLDGVESLGIDEVQVRKGHHYATLVYQLDERFLDAWCTRAMRSKIEPMKRFVKWVRRHRELLMNWFKSKGLLSGVAEGFNNRVKLTARKAYGFHAFESLKIALFHALGRLTEPKYAHRFW